MLHRLLLVIMFFVTAHQPLHALYLNVRGAIAYRQMLYQVAVEKWPKLFDTRAVPENAPSISIMENLLPWARAYLRRAPLLIHTRSVSGDTPLTFIAFLRARSKDGDPTYWKPLIQEFIHAGANPADTNTTNQSK